MFKPAFIRFLLITLCLPLLDYPASAQPATDYQPSVGQEGKDVIWVPTPQALVDKMLDMDKRYRRTSELSLGGAPGIERSPLLSEFLQNATELKDDLFACVDIHRNTLWLVDVKRRRYRGIKFPVEWSMHDVAPLGSVHQLRISHLIGTAFGKVAAFRREIKVIHHFSPEGRAITTLALDAQGRNRGLEVQM